MNESNSNRKEEYHFDKQMTGAKSLEILPPYLFKLVNFIELWEEHHNWKDKTIYAKGCNFC